MVLDGSLPADVLLVGEEGEWVEQPYPEGRGVVQQQADEHAAAEPVAVEEEIEPGDASAPGAAFQREGAPLDVDRYLQVPEETVN